MFDQSGESPRQVVPPLSAGCDLPAFLDVLPVAAYTCDARGVLTHYNQAAAELWGRRPAVNDPGERYCGSARLYTPAGVPVPLDGCWMARSLADGVGYRGGEIVIGRPDGSRRPVTAHTAVCQNAAGEIVGGVNVLLDASARPGRAAGPLSALAAKPPLVPMCAHCKQVREPHGTWTPVEDYLRGRLGEVVSHGICPTCLTGHHPEIG